MKYGLLCAGLIAATSMSVAQANTSTQAKQAQAKYVASSYAQTKYPIVFAHGLTGFIRIGTESFGLDYWHQILGHGACATPQHSIVYHRNYQIQDAQQD